MNEVKGFKTLEKKYGVKVVSEGKHYNPLTGEWIETFKMYASDKELWNKGMSRKDVKLECEKWSKQLLSIKNAELIRD